MLKYESGGFSGSCIVMKVASRQAKDFNEFICNHHGVKNSHEPYSPHITLCLVKNKTPDEIRNLISQLHIPSFVAINIAVEFTMENLEK